MQTTGRPSWLNPWNRIGAMRPVSNTMRRQLGAFVNSPAIASAVDAVLLSRTTTPSRSRTQTWVSSIEISRPAKYSISGLLFQILADPIGLRGRAPAHYPMLKKGCGADSLLIQFSRRIGGSRDDG